MSAIRNSVARVLLLFPIFLAMAAISMAVEQDDEQVPFYKKVESLEKAIEEEPGRVEHYIELAKLYGGRRRCGRVEELFVEAIKLKPDDPKVYKEFYSLFYRCGQKEKAVALAEKAAALSPDDPHPHVLAAKALKDRDEEDRKAKIEHLREALKLQPENGEAHFLLGEVYLRGGDWKSSIEHLKRARELLSPDDRSIRVLPGILEKAEKIRELEKSCEAGSSNWDDYEELARYYSSCRRRDRAEEIMRKAAASINEPWKAYVSLGYMLRSDDRNDEALEAFNQAIRSATEADARGFDNPYRFYKHIGDTYVKMGEFEKALSAYMETAKYEGWDRSFLNKDIGDVYFKLGKYDKALKAYKEADYPLGKARTCRALGKYGEAVSILWGAIERESEERWRGRGRGHEAVDKNGKPVKGLRYKVDPELYMELGNNYRKMGQKGKAAMAYWEALRLSPGSSRASKAIEKLFREKSESQP